MRNIFLENILFTRSEFAMTLSKKRLIENGIELIGTDEKFESVRGYGMYYISNYGRLIHQKKTGQLQIVNPSITNGGYLTYTIYKTKNKKKRRKKGEKYVRKGVGFTANNLVARMFVYNPYPELEYAIEDLQVHHKDKNRTNNYYKNLMWLCKNKNGRKDHDFVHSIDKIGIYSEKTGKYRHYKDIEYILDRLEMNILEFIDYVKEVEENEEAYQDGEYRVYDFDELTIGIIYTHPQN